MATHKGYIENCEQWERYKQLRNKTAHEYSSKNVEHTLLFIEEFINNQKILLTNLQAREN